MDVVADTHQPTFKHIDVDTVMGRPTRGRLMVRRRKKQSTVTRKKKKNMWTKFWQ